MSIKSGLVILGFALLAEYAIAATYIVPPSSSTNANVPYISDEAMERCVKLYNETKWFGAEIEKASVDSYSQSSVDGYNEKVVQFNKMQDDFNSGCAGKQSESAYKAALKLNGGG